MKPFLRQGTVLIGLLGAMTLSLVAPVRGYADPIKTEIELTTKEANAKETALGNLLADAIRDSAKTDAAFLVASSLNEVTIPKGSVTTSDILKSLKYTDDSIVIVKLTGEQVRKALEHGLYLYPKGNGGFLHFAGMTVTINAEAETEKRIVSIKMGDDTLATEKTYTVAMPSPLASGALAYYKIWKKSDIEKDTNKTLETAVTAYLSDKKTLTKGEERLIVKGKKAENEKGGTSRPAESSGKARD